MKRKNFSRESSVFAERASRNFSRLRRSRRAAEDNFTGLRRFLNVPKPRSGSRYTKTERDTPSPLYSTGASILGSFASGGIVESFGGDGGRFYMSPSQMTSRLIAALTQAQRIR